MSDPFDVLQEMAEGFAALKAELAEIRYAMDRQIRHGKVAEVDTKKQLARIEIGQKDSEPVLSAWLPYAQTAGTDGNFKFHNPPVKGQQMTMFAPNGEIRQAVLLPFTWSDNAKSPSEEPGDKEHMLTFGDLKITYHKDEYKMQVTDGSSITITKDSITLDTKKVIIWGSESVSIGGPTWTGVGGKGEKKGEKVITEGGPAKQHWSPPG